MKHKYLVLLLIMVIATIAFFYFSSNKFSYNLRVIDAYDARIREEQERLNSAKVLNEQLQHVAKVIMNTMTTNRRFTTEEVNAFARRLADLAEKNEIKVHGFNHKTISTPNPHRLQHNYSMELHCTFVQMGQLLADLESMNHIVRVETIEIRPLQTDRRARDQQVTIETKDTVYRVNLELAAVKIVKEA